MSMEPCENCNGDGMDPDNDYMLTCPICQGEGISMIYSLPDSDDDEAESQSAQEPPHE